MWMVYQCFCKYFDTIVKPKNAELTDLETEIFHIKALCNSFLEEHQRCYLCEFPLEAKVLNDVKTIKQMLSSRFCLKKRVSIFTKCFIEKWNCRAKTFTVSKVLLWSNVFFIKSLWIFPQAGRVFCRFQPEKVNREYKEFVVEYMGDCSTVEHLHNKIKEFKIYRNKSAPPCQMAFALMYSQYTDFPRDMLLLFLVI